MTTLVTEQFLAPLNARERVHSLTKSEEKERLLAKRVEWQCCAFYQPRKKKHLANSFVARHVRKWVVKRVTRFVAMLIAANRVAGFLLPLLLQPYKKKCYSNPILLFFGAS